MENLLINVVRPPYLRKINSEQTLTKLSIPPLPPSLPSTHSSQLEVLGGWGGRWGDSPFRRGSGLSTPGFHYLALPLRPYHPDTDPKY
ncbi:hypothetical protein WMY93_034079 [Mugilogobius chulae]|uniref:Uncharacterized protein n=1 Tax=Mugilogobius chulae TaxID=88201 RepID=A0AAW0MFG2_9GOBI